MDNDLDRYVERRGGEYLQELLPVMKDLFSTLGLVRQAMIDLHAEFRSDFRCSRLVLYLKTDDPGGPPRALYWAVLRPVPTSIAKASSGSPSKWLLHLPGTLTNKRIWNYSRQSRHADAFYEFDRKRLLLNEVHRKIARAGSAIRRSVRYHYPRESSFALSLKSLNHPDLRSLPSPALSLLQLVWRSIEAVISTEVYLLMLCRGQNDHPLVPGFSVHFERDGHNPTGRVRWYPHDPLSPPPGWVLDDSDSAPVTPQALADLSYLREELTYDRKRLRRQIALVTRIKKKARAALVTASRLLADARRSPPSGPGAEPDLDLDPYEGIPA